VPVRIPVSCHGSCQPVLHLPWESNSVLGNGLAAGMWDSLAMLPKEQPLL